MDRVEQFFDLVLGKAHAQHVDPFPGVGTDALPPGDAPAHLFHDEMAKLLLLGPGEDQGLDADVLLVGLVHHDGGGEVIDHGIDGDLRLEEDQADGVQKSVEGHGEPPHSEAAALFAQAQANHIQPAAAAAAGEDQAGADAGENAAQQAGGQRVVYQHGGRNGDHAVEKRKGDSAYHGFQHEFLAEDPVGVQQDGNVGKKIENTGDVAAAEVQAAPGFQKRPDQLADTHAAAGIESQRDNEVVQGKRRDQFAQDAGQYPKLRTVHSGVEHPIPLLSKRCSLIYVASDIVAPLYSPFVQTAR